MDRKTVLPLAIVGALVAQSVFALDAASALAALKAKYPEALERCSVFEAMHKAKAFQEIDAAEAKTVDAKDWEGFEQVARAGIALKTQPDIWYYNLACALSRQKRIPEALVAFEQCVAAGYRDRSHVEKDGDMDNLRGEKRYAELLDVIDFNDENAQDMGLVKVVNGRFMPTDATTDCDTTAKEECFYATLEKVSNSCPIVYMDRNRPHGESLRKSMPELDLIEMDYPDEMKKYGQDVGLANFSLFMPSARGDAVVPVMTIAATDVTGDIYRGSSLASACGLDADAFIRAENAIVSGDVVQLIAAGRDYGTDGFDRYLGNKRC